MKIKTSMAAKARRIADYTRVAGGKDKPLLFRLIKWKRVALQKDKLEKELFHSCILLKNLAIVYQQMPMSADFMLEQLMESTQLLKLVYADVLNAYRTGKPDDTFRLLYDKLPSDSMMNFVRILRRLDTMNPADLVDQMNAFEATLSAERKTKAMAKAERRSLATTLASTATIFVVLLNFVVVVVFLDTLQTLSQLYM